MSALIVPLERDAAEAQRAAAIFRESQHDVYVRTDRMFSRLMVFQWLFGIGAALYITPRTWIGATSQLHWHVLAAIFLGGLIAGFPVLLVYLSPGSTLTRHTVAVGQMLTSALLIHITGGRIETHFHVFGSLAFLAFYRDWRVLLTATVVVALDHMTRGIFWPQSVFGVLTADSWRWMEHAGWVVFEDVFLLMSIWSSTKDMQDVASRRANLERSNGDIQKLVEELTVRDTALRRSQEELEERVTIRTKELSDANSELQAEMTRREQAQEELAIANRQLLESSRKAGMAEVATGVLHNVGNVLNSVNVSSGVVMEMVRRSRAPKLSKAAALINQNIGNLGEFLSRDPNGSKLPGYLSKLGDYLNAENTELLTELNQLGRSIEHIKEVVAMQQDYAKVSGAFENLSAKHLVEDAIAMNASAFDRHGVELERCFAETPLVRVDRHRVLQILINLMRNAKYALDDSTRVDKKITISILVGPEERAVNIVVADNGVGIAEENLTRIFGHGFTTRKDGHGFGLHSGALAAKEMGGALSVYSAGLGSGAAFTLELPIAASSSATA